MATYVWPKHVDDIICMIKDVYGLNPISFLYIRTSTSLRKKMFGRNPACDRTEEQTARIYLVVLKHFLFKRTSSCSLTEVLTFSPIRPIYSVSATWCEVD